MKNYLKYLEDDSFIDWVYNKSPESNLIWENYLQNNSEEKELILSLKEVLLLVKPEDLKLSGEEKDQIFTQLLGKLENNEKPKKIKTIVKQSYKYAAILLLALVVSALYFSDNLKNTDKVIINDLTSEPAKVIEDTQLILATGEPLLIEQKESIIDNSKLGKVILNSKDTITTAKLENKQEAERLNKLIVPFGRRSKIALSDGTIVHLNAGTKFMFPDKFMSKTRTVFLSGEAFFEVSANKEKPFVVKTIDEKLLIQVLGTKFNVSAYQSDSEIITVLTEGKVNVLENNTFKTTTTTLKPGQLASWNREHESISVKTVNTNNYTLWTSGLLYFESELVSNIVKKIERFYNVNIVFDEGVDEKNITISGKLDLNDKIEKTLENLTITTAFKFEVINEKEYMLK